MKKETTMPFRYLNRRLQLGLWAIGVFLLIVLGIFHSRLSGPWDIVLFVAILVWMFIIEIIAMRDGCMTFSEENVKIVKGSEIVTLSYASIKDIRWCSTRSSYWYRIATTEHQSVTIHGNVFSFFGRSDLKKAIKELEQRAAQAHVQQ